MDKTYETCEYFKSFETSKNNILIAENWEKYKIKSVFFWFLACETFLDCSSTEPRKRNSEIHRGGEFFFHQEGWRHWEDSERDVICNSPDYEDTRIIIWSLYSWFPHCVHCKLPAENKQEKEGVEIESNLLCWSRMTRPYYQNSYFKECQCRTK